ncbi:MAG: hypothetical protein HRU10_03655 [Opitutales bacterium]|nr:hypothetical protein [Opitutales bacterium]
MKNGYSNDLGRPKPTPPGNYLDVQIGANGSESPAIEASDPTSPGASEPGVPKKYLGVHFVECHAYGRMYPNFTNTHFVGRCPKCGQPIRARIGSDGTNARFFRASCERHQKGETQPSWPMH